MTRVLTNLLHLAWALWFGGMVVLLLFVTQLFKKSHATGVDAAPVLFDTFAVFQLAVGAIACIVATILTVMTRRRTAAVFTLLLLVAFAAAIVLRGWTHQIDGLRLAGQTNTDRFRHLHALSGIGYVTAASALLISGLGWMNVRLTRRTVRGTASATNSPDATSDRSPASPTPTHPIQPA